MQVKASLIAIAISALALNAAATSQPTEIPVMLVCTKGKFEAILNPIAWRTGELVVLSMGVHGGKDGAGLGRISEYFEDGSFVANFFLNSQMQLPSDGPRTTIRYIARDRLALILVNPQGQSAGYQVQADCITRVPVRK